MNAPRRHGDPLLLLWRRRIGAIVGLGVFPSIAVPAVVLLLSFALTALDKALVDVTLS